MRTAKARGLRTVGILVLLAAGVAGCAARGAGAKNPFDGDRGMQRIRIEVTNLNWNDATLHALRSGQRHRLGVVAGKGRAEYTMDWPATLPLRIEIDLLASGSCVTRELMVDPGDRIQLQIESDLSMDPECRAAV